MRRLQLAMLVVLIAIAGCAGEDGKEETSDPSAAVRLVVPDGRVTFTVEQRSTTDLPGSGGEIRLTVDDITRGQVMTSVAERDGTSTLAPVSLREDEAETLRIDGGSYLLTLESLDNDLLGDDEATFVLATIDGNGDAAADSDRAALTEEEKIDWLIERVEATEGLAFIRNGETHTAAEAADHLRRKREWLGDDITTADEFIDLAGTASSMSGRPYRVRLPDGREVASAEFLRGLLAEVEDGSADDRP